MRCETSFFSLTLFKKYLTRYWPMWAVWLAGWTLALPVNIWNENRWSHSRYLVDYLDKALAATGVIIAMVAPLVAVAVFFHLFKGPAANFIGALPLRREGIFATAFLAGYTMLAAPLVAVAVLTIFVEWAVGAVAAAPLLTLLGGCLLQSFFWFSFATLCCVISGNGVAAVCFYAIFNFVIAAMTYLIQNVLTAFLYGFSAFGERVWQAVMWLTPTMMMAQSDYTLPELAGVSRMEMLWVYAAVGFLMLLAAVGLHHIRKAERSGDLIAFVPIRWVFRISVTLCGGLAFGLLLMVLLFDGRFNADMGAALAGCCAVAAMVSWFAAEMLLQKSFKVFKGHWKGAIIGAVCFVVAICAIDMDWIGFTTRVPSADQVKGAEVLFGGYVDPIANDGLVYDQDSVADIIALHQYLVDHQPSSSASRDYYGWVELEYDLGLTHLRREYSFRYDKGEELGELMAAAQLSGLPDLDLTLGDPVSGYGYIFTEDDAWGFELHAVQARAAWQALLEDYQAGRYRADDPAGEGNYNYFHLEWMSKGHQTGWETVYVHPGATSLNQFLADLQAGKYGSVDSDLAIDHGYYPMTEEVYYEEIAPGVMVELSKEPKMSLEPTNLPLETPPSVDMEAPVEPSATEGT